MRCTVTATGDGGSLESPLTISRQTNYTVTVGAGGAGQSNTARGGAGGSGVVILRWTTAQAGDIVIGQGLTGSTAVDGTSTVATITAGSGNVIWL
jgi:hypothetical protein